MIEHSYGTMDAKMYYEDIIYVSHYDIIANEIIWKTPSCIFHPIITLYDIVNTRYVSVCLSDRLADASLQPLSL